MDYAVPGVILIWVVCTAIQGHVDVCGPGFLWEYCLVQWSYCSWVSCSWSLLWLESLIKTLSMLPLTVERKEDTFVVISMTSVHSWAGGIWKAYVTTPTPHNPNKTSSLDRKSSHRTLSVDDGDVEVRSPQLKASGMGLGGEELSSI